MKFLLADPAQVRKDALDEVIVYLEGEIKKLVEKMSGKEHTRAWESGTN